MNRMKKPIAAAAVLFGLAFFVPRLQSAPLPDYVADFRKAAMGDATALDRAMKADEAALSADPKDAQAEVWHGVGLMMRSKALADGGDYEQAGQVFEQGVHETDVAAALSPDDPRVLLPRGTSVLRATLFLPQQDSTTELLRSGLDNYLRSVDKVTGEMHNRVLYGIADAYFRLGQTDQAKKYFERVAEEAKGTGYAANAKTWLNTKWLSREQEICAGCDTESH